MLNQQRLINRDKVFQLKMNALGKLWKCFDDDAAQLAWDELLQLLADARMFLESLRGHGQGLNHA